jgi:hypothetical protein
MKRVLLLLVGLVPLCACSPDVERLVAWLHEQRSTAEAAGQPCPEYAGDVAWRGLPEHFLVVISRESGCDPSAINDHSDAHGLTQIMPMWLDALCQKGIACTKDDLLTVARNLDAALYVYTLQGPAAWRETWYP